MAAESIGSSTPRLRKIRGWPGAVVIALAALCPGLVNAAADEIQVYIDDVLPRGERGLELHTNYVTRGRSMPDYPGEKAPAHILRVTPEFSFGLGNNWDWGIYLPFSADEGSRSTFMDDAKLRVKHLIKHERDGASEFYGANLEIAHSPRRVSASKWNGELRGIAGMRRGPWLFAVNPILSTPLSASTAGSTVDFDIDVKISREVGRGVTLGLENYSELGPLRRPAFGAESSQATFATLDFEGKGWDVNFGLGRGWKANSDRNILKMIVGLPF
jgi:hypothetical protein